MSSEPPAPTEVSDSQRFESLANHRIWPGIPSPLGAMVRPDGVNFALFSDNATKVELCLFDSPERSFAQMDVYPLQGRSMAVLQAESTPIKT